MGTSDMHFSWASVAQQSRNDEAEEYVEGLVGTERRQVRPDRWVLGPLCWTDGLYNDHETAGFLCK